MLATHLSNLVTHGRISPLEYYVCPRFRVVYVENAKVACSAIKQALFPEVDHEKLGQENFHAVLRSRATFAPPGGIDGQYLHFSFFRDPLARLESCFQDKIQRHESTGDPGIFSLRFHRALFLLFGGQDLNRPDVGLEEFVQAIANIPDRLRDRHIMSQSPIYRAVSAAPYHFIGKFETLAEDWLALSSRTGLPPLSRINTSTHREKVAPVAAATLRRLHQAYADDYGLLRYPKPGSRA